MYTFRYKATTPQGFEEKGKIDAENEAEAMESLKADGLYVISMRKLTFLETFDVGSLLPVPLTEVEEFYRQMAFLLQAGIPLDASLLSIAKMIKHKRFKQAIIKVAKGLAEGVKFSEGISKYPKIFPVVATSTIKVAEENGDYEKTFMNLADYFKRLREMRGKLFGALGYPAFIFIFAIAVTYYLSNNLIPQMVSSLMQDGGHLPPLTVFVMSVAHHYGEVGLGAGAFTALIIGANWYIKRNADLKYIVDRFYITMPFLGNILTEIFQARFCDSISTLLSGGLPVAGAIGIVGKNMTNEAMKRVILKAGEDLKIGKKLSTTLEESKLFTYSLVLVTAIGERTGKMDESFFLLAKKYEAETDKILKRLVNIITPVTILILGVIVGIVAMAMIQAMTSVSDSY